MMKYCFYAFLISLFWLISAAYFYILWQSDSDLMQMRRILLTGCILLLDSAVFFVLVFQFSTKSLRLILREKWNRILFLSSILLTLAIAATFQTRLPDAYRHAYASAFFTYYLDTPTAEKLGNMVEMVTSHRKGALFNSGMDQCNNHSGRKIAQDIRAKGGSWRAVEAAIDIAYKEKALIISKRQYKDILACYQRNFSHQKNTIDLMSKSQKFSL